MMISSICLKRPLTSHIKLVIRCQSSFANSSLLDFHHRLKPPRRAPNILVLQNPLRHFSSSLVKHQQLAAENIGKVENVTSQAKVTSEAPETLEAVKQSMTELIPDKPLPLENIPQALLGEPSFESLGLATWSPSGRFQYIMENIHIGLDMPWWASIMIMTVGLRILMFPLVVMAQRNAAKMNRAAPEMAEVRARISDAEKRGDVYQKQKALMDIHELYKKYDFGITKSMLPMLIQGHRVECGLADCLTTTALQAGLKHFQLLKLKFLDFLPQHPLPFFMSMFFGLRGMANLPVESMTSGGALWFPDLTMADPFYLLPVMTTMSIYLQIYFASDGMQVESLGTMGKIGMGVLPLMAFVFTHNFVSAVTFYWVTTNSISIFQTLIVRSPGVRKILKIPKFIKWTPEQLGKTQSGKGDWRRSIREVWNTPVDLRASDEAMFRQAGKTKIRRTYKFDPLKPRIN